jgi:hypothetical protein
MRRSLGNFTELPRFLKIVNRESVAPWLADLPTQAHRTRGRGLVYTDSMNVTGIQQQKELRCIPVDAVS